MAKVTMPQLGESVAEGTIGKWLKKPGDSVAKDEPLLEVITDKVNAEVPSPFAGVLREILVEEGETVPYNAEIAEIEETARGRSAWSGRGRRRRRLQRPPPWPRPRSAAAAAPAAAAAASGRPRHDPEPLPVAPRHSGARAGDAGRGRRAERRPGRAHDPGCPPMLREHGLTPAQIVGTGHAGRITREDVMTFVERPRTGSAATTAPAGSGAATAGAPAAARPVRPPFHRRSRRHPCESSRAMRRAWHRPPLRLAPSPAVTWEPGQDEVLVPHNQMRRGIAAQMTRAAAVPVAHSTFEADMTSVVNLRAALADAYKAREGVGLSFLPFVVKAVGRGPDGAPGPQRPLHRGRPAAQDGTSTSASPSRSRGTGDGLIVPVIHDADQLSINGINRAIQDLAARARSNKLRLDDLQGGTFTVDNTGWFGSILTVPIINPPEVCILTTEAVVKRPVVRETPDGDVIAVRSMMNLVAGYDHRATDGAQVGKFVRDVICWLEAVGPDTPIY